MKKISILALSLFTILLVFPLDIASAQGPVNMGFVTCSGADCSACHLVSMVNTLIVWFFGIIFLLFAVLMFKAGFGLVTSGGNQSALDAAKSSFQNAVIGLIIVMAAWLIVDTVMRGVLDGGNGEIPINGWGPWAQVKCQVQTQSVQNAGTGEIPAQNGTPADPAINAACTDDSALIAKYKGSPIGIEAPGLRTMINCYLSDS